MSSGDHLSRLRRYQAHFADSIDAVPADAPVLHCGDWTVRELVEHLSEIHVWAADRACGRAVAAALPDAADGLAAHYRRAAEVLVSALDSLDPDQPCWTLLDDDAPAAVRRVGTVCFWHRRQANETLVHLWDLRTAGGLALDLPADEWLDCLSEVVTVMAPRQLRLGRIPPRTVALRFATTDGPVLALPAAEGVPTLTVHGSSEQLALLAWGRLDAASLELDGDRGALASVLVGIVP